MSSIAGQNYDANSKQIKKGQFAAIVGPSGEYLV
jgi:ABC-type lipoprotein export system ATPase subunit